MAAARDETEDISVRKNAITWLGYYQHKDSRFVEPLLDLLNNYLEQLGTEIIRALGAINIEGEPKQAVMPLLGLIRHPTLGITAVIALGYLKDGRAIEPLFNLLKNPPLAGFDKFFTVEALINLGAKDEQLVTYLIATLLDLEQDKFARYTAANLLGYIGNIEAYDALLGSLGDYYSSVRHSSATALGELKDIRAVEPLIELLKDPDASVRGGAATGLGNLGDKRAIEPLTKLLGDSADDYEAQDGAVWALDKISQA